MTLGDMASYVAGKVRQTDAAALARCKQFLNKRHEMIWNDALWRSSVYGHDFTFDPSPALTEPFGNYWSQQIGIRSLPPTVDRVLALRRSDAPVMVEQQEGLYRCSLDEFEQMGAPVKFAILPAAVVDLSSLDEASVLSEGVIFTAAAGDAGIVLRITYLDFHGEEKIEEITLVAGVNGMAAGPRIIQAITHGALTAACPATFDSELLFTLEAMRTSAKVYPRIRLLPLPQVETECKVLVKKKPRMLTSDADEVEIPGLDNCLMSFAQADMLQYARQYGKADAVVREAMALLAQVKSMEVVQQATRCQVTPVVEEMAGDYETSKAWYM